MLEQPDFIEKVALVTGAGRGLGRAIAEAFASRGAIVAINDITPVNLDTTLERIRAKGGRAQDYIFDVAKYMPVQNMIDQVLTDFGQIDILVNNATVRPQAALLEFDGWDWQRTLDVNLSAAFFTTQLVGKAMRLQGGGVIVNIAAGLGSAQAAAGQSAAGRQTAFFASKFGLIGLTRAAAAELAAYRIRVNAVCPVETSLKPTGEVGPQAPMGRETSTARDAYIQAVVEKVMFLCSPAAANLTGQIVDIPGVAGMMGDD